MNAVESMENNAVGCCGDTNSSGLEKTAMEKLDNILKEYGEKLERSQSKWNPFFSSYKLFI
jgi:hypothetical protein